MKKRLWAVLLAVCMAITMVPMTALAAEAVDYSSDSAVAEAKETYQQADNKNFWYAGADKAEDAVYAYLTENDAAENASDGQATYTLTISGRGQMKNYNSGTGVEPSENKPASDRPWITQRSYISTVVIEDGVTYIGAYAFANFTILKNVTLCDTLLTIGHNAFYYSGGKAGIEELTFPNHLERIEYGAFTTCIVKCNVVRVPASVTYIGSQALQFNAKTSTVSLLTVESASLTVAENAFKYNAQVLDLSRVETLTADGTIEYLTQRCPGMLAYVSDAKYISYFGTIGTHIKAVAVTNDGTFAADTTFEAGELAAPVKSDYKFVGWYDNADCSGNSTIEATAGHTYYAKWEPRQLSEITVAPEENTVFTYGSALNAADFVVTKVYDNDETETVESAAYTVSPAELTAVGKTTVTITYQEQEYPCNITVVKAAQDAPAAPTLKTSDYTGITLNTVEANANGAEAQYRCNDGAWQDSPEFTGLTAGTVYTFAVRYAETDTYAASEAGDTAEFSTLRYFPGSSGSSTGSPVTVSSAKNGDVTVSPKTAKKGDTVTVTVTPDKGYTLETLTVLDKNGSKLTLTDKGNGQYTFTMPDGKVEVRATFMDDNTMLNHFVDVQAGDYFYDAVLWAVKNGITKGVSDTDFGPELACTRAQIVTFLWRAAGSPEPKNAGSFTDVSADSYYAKAVAWAVENGITGGTGDGRFSPDAPCTREQAVAFLYRASGSPAVSGGSAFSDVAADAYYASAVTWAEQNGVTGGIGGGLFGSGNDCTRAQIVTFLYRAYQGK